MQDKLIKIIDEAYGGFTDDLKKRLSKQLLDNGVIVPPLNINDAFIEENYCEWIGYDYKTIRSPNLNDFPQVMTVPPVRTEEYLMAELEHKKIIGSDAGYNVFCIKCGASGARGMTREEAIKKWNERR